MCECLYWVVSFSCSAALMWFLWGSSVGDFLLSAVCDWSFCVCLCHFQVRQRRCYSAPLGAEASNPNYWTAQRTVFTTASSMWVQSQNRALCPTLFADDNRVKCTCARAVSHTGLLLNQQLPHTRALLSAAWASALYLLLSCEDVCLHGE